MNKERTKFGKLLRDYREINGLSLRAFGEKIGYSKQYIADIENGKSVSTNFLKSLRIIKDFPTSHIFDYRIVMESKPTVLADMRRLTKAQRRLVVFIAMDAEFLSDEICDQIHEEYFR